MIPVNLSPKNGSIILEPKDTQHGLKGVLDDDSTDHLPYRCSISGEYFGTFMYSALFEIRDLGGIDAVENQG